jgi:hypothetical protein
MAKLGIVAAFLVAISAAAQADARVLSVAITRVQSPAFAGASFGSVGQYEKLVGTITGEVDPADPKNALITDIAFAPRTARGTVSYTTPLYILRPIDPSAGNHSLIFEPPNRGNKYLLPQLNTFGRIDNTIGNANDPISASDAGDGLLMRQGYTLAWAGWEVVPGATFPVMSIDVPIAQRPDGEPITGRVLFEATVGVPGVVNRNLPFNAADPTDPVTASLTMREHYADTPVPISGWTYPFAGRWQLPAGQTMAPGWLYEFTYTATGSPVSGLGFAAVRDVVAFLRHGEGALASPLGADIATSFGAGFSQSGRFLRDFVRLGFNASEDGTPVFDGIAMHEAGANGVFLNARFAQPDDSERQHTDRWDPEGRFPFAWNTTTDPVTGRQDGALARCTASATCPKIVETLTANEYWEKAASLLTTDPAGTSDLPDAPGVRTYLFASLPHAAASARGICAQPQNPLNGHAGLRALFADLDAWVRNGTEPPPSQVPRLADRTLWVPWHQAGVHFPAIPGVAYRTVATVRNARDWGDGLGPDGGVITRWPPIMLGVKSPSRVVGPGIYPSYVPTTDALGNDTAGIRLPDIAAPIATFTGWGLQGPGFAVGDSCLASGQMIALPPTPAAALATGDPRPALAALYPTHAAYVAAVTAAAQTLEAQRLLLPRDVATYIAAANASTVGTGSAKAPAPLGQ